MVETSTGPRGDRLHDQGRLFRRLLAAVSVLVLCHLVTLYLFGADSRIMRMFDLNAEANLPTWFSSALLLMGGWTAYQCARRSPRPHQQGWLWLAAGLVFMSCDETAQIHDAVGDLFHGMVVDWSVLAPLRPVLKVFRASWVIAVTPFVAGWMVWEVRQLRRGLADSPRAARLIALGAVLFVGGAFGLESVKYAIPPQSPAWVWLVRMVLEESLEMVGSTTVLAGLWAHQAVLDQRGTAGEPRTA